MTVCMRRLWLRLPSFFRCSSTAAMAAALLISGVVMRNPAVLFHGIVGNDVDIVILSVAQEVIQLHEKVAVTSGKAACIVPVNVNPRVLVDSFKFQNGSFVRPVFRDEKAFVIEIETAGIEAGLMLIFSVLSALLQDHGVMGECDGCPDCMLALHTAIRGLSLGEDTFQSRFQVS